MDKAQVGFTKDGRVALSIVVMGYEGMYTARLDECPKCISTGMTVDIAIENMHDEINRLSEVDNSELFQAIRKNGYRIFKIDKSAIHERA